MMALPFIAAGGQLLQGFGQMQEANYQSAVMAQNASIADENASRANAQAATEAMDQDLRAKMEIGSLMSELGASGLSLQGGSALTRRRDLNQLALRDRTRLIEGGRLTAQQKLQEAADLRAQSKATKKAGKWSMLGSVLSATTSFLDGQATVKATNYKRTL